MGLALLCDEPIPLDDRIIVHLSSIRYAHSVSTSPHANIISYIVRLTRSQVTKSVLQTLSVVARVHLFSHQPENVPHCCSPHPPISSIHTHTCLHAQQLARGISAQHTFARLAPQPPQRQQRQPQPHAGQQPPHGCRRSRRGCRCRCRRGPAARVKLPRRHGRWRRRLNCR